MATDKSTKRSRKSKNKKQRTNDGRNNSARKEGGFQRLDAVERLPSNAPTMAIAPSDYEHIFHEGATAQNPQPPTPPPQPQPPATGVLPTVPPRQTPHSPSPPPPPLNFPRPRTPEEVNPGQHVSHNKPPYSAEVQVTPDGYTLLGHLPDPSHRRALPPHIVRASNQFSRAALNRVSKYLASRAEYR